MAVKKIIRKKTSLKKKTVKKNPKLDFELPTAYSDISDNINDYMIMLSGERKIGKTTLFQQFGKCFYVMCDRNLGLKLKQKRITSWDEFLRIIELLEENPRYCELVVIDTGYTLYEFCFKYVCEEFNVKDPRDKGWGVVWKSIFMEFTGAHERILAAGYGLGVVAHSEEKEKPEGGTKLKAKLSAQAYTYYTGLADVLGHYQYSNSGDRELIIRGSAYVDAGTNIDEHFMYTNGVPITKIPMGKTKEQAYKNFLAAFNNELIQKEGHKRKKKSYKRN